MIVSLIYIYINRPGEMGDREAPTAFLGEGGSVENCMQVILKSNSVELSGVGQ